jgi:hypothetical protein
MPENNNSYFQSPWHDVFSHITHFTPSRHRFFLSSSVQDVRIHQEIQARALVSWSTLISVPFLIPRIPVPLGPLEVMMGEPEMDMRNDMTLRTCGFFAWKISQKMGYDILWYTPNFMVLSCFVVMFPIKTPPIWLYFVAPTGYVLSKGHPSWFPTSCVLG